MLERWLAPDGSPSQGRLSPRSLLRLSRQRAAGELPTAPPSSARERNRKGKKPPLAPGGAPNAKVERFTVVLARGAAGLGLVCDDDGRIEDMV